MESVVRIDSKGRIVIPKHIREAIGVKEGGFLKLKVVEGKIVVEPVEDAANRFYGVFRVENWPEDLDEFVVEAVKNWWRRST